MYLTTVHLPLCDMRTRSAVRSLPAYNAKDALSHVRVTGWMGAWRNGRVARLATADRDGRLAKETASRSPEPPSSCDMTTRRCDFFLSVPPIGGTEDGVWRASVRPTCLIGESKNG